MTLNWRGLASVAVAAALVAAGCGSNGAAEVPASGITKAGFLKRADAICWSTYHRVEGEFKAFTRREGPEPFGDDQKIRKYATTVLVPAKRREVRELRALGSPEGDEERVGTLVAAYEKGIERAEAEPRVAVMTTFGVFNEATELAEEYGLEHCRY